MALESILIRDLDGGFYDMQHNFYITSFGIFEGRGFNFTGYANFFSIEFFDCDRDEFKTKAMNRTLEEGSRLGFLMPFEYLVFDYHECPTTPPAT